MTGLITNSLAGAIVSVLRSVPGGTSSVSSADHSVSYAGANITITADSLPEIERQLAAKRKLAQLVSPTYK